MLISCFAYTFDYSSQGFGNEKQDLIKYEDGLRIHSSTDSLTFSLIFASSELDASSVKAVWKLKLKTSAGGRAKQRHRNEWEFIFKAMVTMFVSKWCHFVVFRCWYLLIELHQGIDDLCSNLSIRYSSREKTTCSKNYFASICQFYGEISESDNDVFESLVDRELLLRSSLHTDLFD